MFAIKFLSADYEIGIIASGGKILALPEMDAWGFVANAMSQPSHPRLMWLSPTDPAYAGS